MKEERVKSDIKLGIQEKANDRWKDEENKGSEEGRGRDRLKDVKRVFDEAKCNLGYSRRRE